MKEYICPHSCSWPCRNMVFSANWIHCHRSGMPDRIKLVKKRHPLEVAIIKEIARLRRVARHEDVDKKIASDCEDEISLLRRLLKEGRK